MKITINIILFVFIYLCVYLLPLKNTDTLITTVFTVSSILFSVALSIVASVNLLSVKNISTYKKLAETLRKKRNSVIIWFFIIIISFVASFIKLDYQYAYSLFITFTTSLCLFFTFKIALQFKDIQDFKSDLDNAIQNDISKQ